MSSRFDTNKDGRLSLREAEDAVAAILRTERGPANRISEIERIERQFTPLAPEIKRYFEAEKAKLRHDQEVQRNWTRYY